MEWFSCRTRISVEKYFQTTDTEKQSKAYLASQLSITDLINVALGNRQTKYELNNIDQTINTPYAGIVYQKNEQISAYTSYTEIFSSQQARDINNNILDPVIGSNIELGFKCSLLDDALVVTAAIFKAEKDNVAEVDPNATEPLADGTIPSRGVKGTNHQGYEFDATGNLSESLILNFSYSHVESEYPNGDDFSSH